MTKLRLRSILLLNAKAKGQKEMIELAEIRIELSPFMEKEGEGLSRLDICVRVDGYGVPEGGILAEIGESVAAADCCEIRDLVFASDEADRPVIFSVTHQETRPELHTIRFIAERPVEGAYCYRYSVLPRRAQEGDGCAPPFAFRAEEGGASGFGVAFLALPEFEKEQVAVRWNLGRMPDGSHGVCAFFEGEGEIRCSRDELWFAGFACGMLRRKTEGDLGVYWFGSSPFDVQETSGRLKQLFDCIRKFFGEREGLSYRIFVRRDPFADREKETAGYRSLLVDCSGRAMPAADSLTDLLSCGMTHSWIAMKDETAAAGRWYVDGCAAYYSLVLPLRAGLVTAEYVRQALERRAALYFGNPYRTLTNQEAGRLYWRDSAARQMFGARGFFYLVQTDGQIRRASQGKRSLDNLVLAMCAVPAERQTEKVYLRLLEEELGENGLGDYRRMAQGELQIPDEEMFDGLFSVRPTEEADDAGEGSCVRYHFRMRENEYKKR